jgi:hypothetical protein
VKKDRADVDAGRLATADRRLDLTPNPALSLRVRLQCNRGSTIGLVAEGLPRLLLRRGKAIGQAGFFSRWRSCCDNIFGVSRLAFQAPL